MDWVSIVAIIGSIGTIIGIPLSIILYRNSIRKKMPVWGYTTSRIIGLSGNVPLKLGITFDGRQLTEVYRTQVILFNKGKEVIDKTDLLIPIVVQLLDGEILDAPEIRAFSRDEIQIKSSHIFTDTGDLNSVEFDFAYLDHNDGVVVEILHTKYSKIICKSNIKGAKQVKLLPGFNPYMQGGSLRSFVWPAIGIVVLLAAYTGFIAVTSGFVVQRAIAAFGAIIIGALSGFFAARPRGSRIFDAFPKWSFIVK